MSGVTLDTLGTIIAALLTVMILSYLIADNVLFRIATYLFIGVASGYAGAIAWNNVLRPGLIDPIVSGGPSSLFQASTIGTLLLPWLLVVLLLLKAVPSASRYGSLPLALLVGVGAAVVVGGGITGTLIPQSTATASNVSPEVILPLPGEDLASWSERLFSGLIMILATLTTLVYFRFSARRQVTGQTRRSRLTAWAAAVGKVFIAVTFGVMYAGALMATLLVLAQRFQFLREVIAGLFAG